MSYTLVLIDVQPQFYAATNKRTQKNCGSEIRKAIKNNVPIVFVEYITFGKTVPKLTKIVKESNYTNVYRLLKQECDGSPEISKLLKQKNLSKHLRVGGVNTEQCVLETVAGLVKNNSDIKITVVNKACNSEYSHQLGIDLLSNLQNVQVV